jgi:hypothetical protein
MYNYTSYEDFPSIILSSRPSSVADTSLSDMFHFWTDDIGFFSPRDHPPRKQQASRSLAIKTLFLHFVAKVVDLDFFIEIP